MRFWVQDESASLDELWALELTLSAEEVAPLKQQLDAVLQLPERIISEYSEGESAASASDSTPRSATLLAPPSGGSAAGAGAGAMPIA